MDLSRLFLLHQRQEPYRRVSAAEVAQLVEEKAPTRALLLYVREEEDAFEACHILGGALHAPTHPPALRPARVPSPTRLPPLARGSQLCTTRRRS